MAAAAGKMRSAHMRRVEKAHSAAAPAMAATAATPGMAATTTAPAMTTAPSATPVTGERGTGRAQGNYDGADAYGQSQCGKIPVEQTHLPYPNMTFP